MPVSYFPCVLPLLLIAVPLLCLPRGKKPFLMASAGSTVRPEAFEAMATLAGGEDVGRVGDE
jgi:hypothetical protein